jgi:hypothetical protein
MTQRIERTRKRQGLPHKLALGAAIAAICALPGTVGAFEIPAGNDDLALRWDNTIRYNLGMRMKDQDEAILKNVNQDDGDRNFSQHSLVTNRIDLLSEFDFVYQKRYGFRVSAAAWYDAAYRNLDNTNTLSSNTLVDGLPVAGRLSTFTERYAKGVSGEFLDAFVFGSFDAGDVPINVKLGQATVYWGESLFGNGAVHGISYSQSPIDSWKSAANPGAEAKELFRPRVGLNVQAQVT